MAPKDRITAAWPVEVNRKPIAQTAATKAEKAGRSRIQAIVAAELDELIRTFDPHQPRDPTGKWSLVGAVRQALADAGDVDELNTAAAAEAKRITGRDTHFDFTGCDVQVGREHAEGVLRGLERFPKTKLTKVSTFGPGGAEEWGGAHARAFAVTTDTHRQGLGTSEIHFNTLWAGKPEAYREYLAANHSQGWGVAKDPQGVALHEFGHAVDNFTEGRASFSAALHIASSDGDSGAVASGVSHYAAHNGMELMAEVFADVIINGDNASDMSKSMFGIVQQHYDDAARRVRGSAKVPK
jgi:hypothetical protein